MHPKESITPGMVKKLEGMSSQKRLRTLGLFGLEERTLRDNLIALHSLLWRESGKGGADLISLVSSDRMHGNSSKLLLRRFRLCIRKHFFHQEGD